MFNKRGFTLIELVMIVVILGILAAVAVPRYFDMQAQATQAAERGVVGGVRAGIMTFFAQNRAYPATLDAAAVAACTTTNACFTTVLQQGAVTSDWTKLTATTYRGPTTTVYTYTPATGDFQ